jgi:DNA polymerase-3 subunit gamma/tau
MNYQVLARKYRPRSFAEMVGQEHALRALINALTQQRLHHAYLFTGTRGVGKTTIARILAKCLNCETGITATPCDQCKSCEEINTGRFVDLIEVDAASRTKVEDTRDLLDNVQYAPTRGRYKVYLIDEVHMLSGHSFNALLKTLEEPPSHVIFLLATTDPQRLPVTVLSRCLQFNLKNLTAEKITAHFEQVLQQEQIPFETIALQLLAKGANGSLRDGLSLLDQAIAYGGGNINETDVRAMLGTIEQTHILRLLTALAENNPALMMTIVAELAEHAADFNNALEDLLTALHQTALLQTIPDLKTIALENSEQYQHFAKQISAADIQLYYQIALIGRRDLALAPTPRSGFEMILLRMNAFRLNDSVPEKKTLIENNNIQPKENIGLTSASASTQKIVPEAKNPAPVKKIAVNDDWSAIISNLNLSGMTQALALHCSLQKRSENEIHLLLDANQAALHNPKQEARLAEALSSYFGQAIALQIHLNKPTENSNLATPARIEQQQQTARLQVAEEALNKDANIQAIIQSFDAKIRPGSVQVKEKI